MPFTLKKDEYPPPAFHFKVVFSAFPEMDTSFQEVSGIGYELVFEEVKEGADIYQLPKSVKYPLLSLKRGIANKDSPLVKWCKSIMEGDFNSPIKPMEVQVYLLNEDQNPLRGWSFANVFPVKWNIDPFNSKNNEVAIEKIELYYNFLERII